MPKTQNQLSEQSDPPDLATKEEKHQVTEISAKESLENQQPEKTAE